MHESGEVVRTKCSQKTDVGVMAVGLRARARGEDVVVGNKMFFWLFIFKHASYKLHNILRTTTTKVSLYIRRQHSHISFEPNGGVPTTHLANNRAVK